MSYRVGLLPLNAFDAAGQGTTQLACSQMVLESVFDNWLPRMSESQFSCAREGLSCSWQVQFISGGRMAIFLEWNMHLMMTTK